MNKGFSLIETLVAVVVLITAVVGPLTLAQRSIRSAVYARDQVIAGFLADEAVEYIRSMRDQNQLERDNWVQGLSDCMGTGRLCTVDATQERNEAIERCKESDMVYGSECPLLAFHTASGRYGYKPTRNAAEWENTRFVREVSLITIPGDNRSSDDEAKVEVRVLWQTGNFPVRTVITRAYLYDW